MDSPDVGLPTKSGGFLWPKPVDCKKLAVMVRSFFLYAGVEVVRYLLMTLQNLMKRCHYLQGGALNAVNVIRMLATQVALLLTIVANGWV